MLSYSRPLKSTQLAAQRSAWLLHRADANADVVSLAVSAQPSRADSRPPSRLLPVLLDVEGPVELQECVLVVVHEFGDGLVVTAADHAGGCGFGLDWGDVS